MNDDFIGKGVPASKSPAGFGLNTKTGSLDNAEFDGITPNGNLIFREGDNAKAAEEQAAYWDDADFFDNDFDELISFSRMETVNDIELYAKQHGPLFGSRFAKDGVIREPVEMWLFAAQLMDLAMQFQAAFSTKNWEVLQNQFAAFEVEILLNDHQANRKDSGKQFILTDDQAFVAYAITRFSEIPKDYIALTLTPGKEFENGIWKNIRCDGPGVEVHSWIARPIPGIGLFDQSLEDKIKTAEENHPNISSAVFANFGRLNTLDRGIQNRIIRTPLEQTPLDKEMGYRLCRGMAETLISMHTRFVRFDWVRHEFRPIFFERIRYLWYLFGVYKDRKVLSFCINCGKPFLKTRKDKKHCNGQCRRGLYDKKRG